MRKQLLLLLVVGMVLVITGCSSVPYTNRSRYLAYSQSEENELGKTAWEEIKKEQKISTDSEKNAMLARVVKKLIPVSGMADLDWEYLVFESETENAFALPGGKIAFYSGIFKYFNSDDELAVVAAHEIAHVIARHSNEGMSQQNIANIAGVASVLTAYILTDGDTAATAVTGAVAYGGLNYGFLLPYSRTHEAEADEIGIVLMAKAGFDVDVAVPFWQKFGNDSTISFFSTHPSSSDRIENIKRVISELKSGTHTSGVVIRAK